MPRASPSIRMTSCRVIDFFPHFAYKSPHYHRCRGRADKCGEREIMAENPDPFTMSDITRHPAYRDAYDLAMQKHRAEPMSPSEITEYIRQIIASFTGAGRPGGPSPLDWPKPASPDAWQDYITEDSITCMICLQKYQLLTKAHLRHHGGNKKQYRAHFGIPADVSLAAKGLVEQRRKDIATTRIWELRNRERRDAQPVRTAIRIPRGKKVDGNDTLSSLLGIEEREGD